MTSGFHAQKAYMYMYNVVYMPKQKLFVSCPPSYWKKIVSLETNNDKAFYGLTFLAISHNKLHIKKRNIFLPSYLTRLPVGQEIKVYRTVTGTFLLFAHRAMLYTITYVTILRVHCTCIKLFFSRGTTPIKIIIRYCNSALH